MGRKKLYGSLSTLFIVLWALAGSCPAGSADFTRSPEYMPDQVLVRFAPSATKEEKQALRDSFNVKKYTSIKNLKIERWTLPQGSDVGEIVKSLLSRDFVDKAEPNLVYRQNSLPDDPLLNTQWYLHNTGQEVNGTPGLAGADISADQAWDLETGDQDMVIAVIDSGCAFDHPDLIDNTWTNPGEIPDNGLDDDENGYVDDVHGWDFVNEDNNPSDYSRDLYGDGHGTHVSGIIAASGNNARGISGVMWRASLMPLQIFDLYAAQSFQESLAQSFNILQALDYAVTNNARIINCSFGGPGYSAFMLEALREADEKGVLVVCAAGNDGTNTDLFPSYPASYGMENILSVAATDSGDLLTDYSNYGNTGVDMAAPGGNGATPNINSTAPPERVSLFFDDFESGTGKWTFSGLNENWSLGYASQFDSTVLMDSTGAYANEEDSWARTSAPINTVNCRGLHIEFLYDFSLETNFDYLLVETSSNGADYDVKYYATGDSSGVGIFRDWENDRDQGTFFLGFRLTSDESMTNDGAYIDDVSITGIPWEFKGDEYGYKSGTSMAAPVVSGLAGLVWSAAPDLTHYQVRQVIMDSVDKLEVLRGKVKTGGRVNAEKALRLALGLSADTGGDTETPEAAGSFASSGNTGAGEGGGGGCFINSLSISSCNGS